MLRSRKAMSFEDLMQAVSEDEQHRKLISWICRQHQFQRRSFVRTQLEIMSLMRALAEIHHFFESVEDDDFAVKVIQFSSTPASHT